MEKSFLEKAIELRAEETLKKEYEAFFSSIKKSMFNGLRIGAQSFCGSNSDCFFTEHIESNKNPEICELIDKRRKILIKEETWKVLENLDSIKYLFNQNA